ncbi:MAG TPA: hypothetical protein VFW28_17900 [Micropepsaceae bacterium]|nr:hypothetical protein [Micropepsaceae bacterium]
MTEESEEPFGGFHPDAIRTFYVKGRGLAVNRSWSRRNNVDDTTRSQECSAHITAKGYGNRDDVCVIGTEKASSVFALTIRPEKDAKSALERWANTDRLRKLGAGEQTGETPEQRLWSHINDELKKEPPTAFLGFIERNWELGISEGWFLDCDVPPSVFDALTADIVNRDVDEVGIGIRWVAGLVRDRHAPPVVPTTWGLFTLPGSTSPETMNGHVTAIGWQPRSKDSHSPNNSNVSDPAASKDPFDKVVSLYRKSIRERSKEEKTPSWNRRSRVLSHIAQNVAHWCKAHGKEPGATLSYLTDVDTFIENLDLALHPAKSPFAKDFSLWQHRNFLDVYKKTKPSQRHEMFDISALDTAASEYLEKPWVQCPYLDWMMLDASTASTIVITLEQLLGSRHGMAYELFDGSTSKILLWKLVTKLLAFAFGWIAPAIGFYYLAQWSPALGIALAIAYYSLSFLMLGRWIWYRLLLLLTRTKTPLQKIIAHAEAAEETYRSLAGEVLHPAAVRAAFRRAEDAGVSWDHKVHYILDRTSALNGGTWKSYQPLYFEET